MDDMEKTFDGRDDVTVYRCYKTNGIPICLYGMSVGEYICP